MTNPEEYDVVVLGSGEAGKYLDEPVVVRATRANGAPLVNAPLAARNHTVTFDAQNLASGVYFYQIQAGEFVQARSLLLLK